MNRKMRWIPARTTLGQTEFSMDQAGYESAPSPGPAPAAAPMSPTVSKGLIYGGSILAGLALAWLVTRKA